MSSREIAELTGKNHADMMRDIRRMLDDLGEDVSSFAEMSPDSYGRPQPVFNLPKDLTITLVAGYSTPLRFKIIKRWQALDTQPRPPAQTQGSLVFAGGPGHAQTPCSEGSEGSSFV